MQSIRKIFARGVIGLGAAALLLSGIPAQANPVSGAASQESQPRLLAQSKAQPGEAEQLKKGKEQPQQQPQSQPKQEKKAKKAKMRGAMPEASREAMPSAPGAKRFGAGVIRKSEKPVDEE